MKPQYVYDAAARVGEMSANKWKFTIAQENTLMPGCVSEKILDPLAGW